MWHVASGKVSHPRACWLTAVSPPQRGEFWVVKTLPKPDDAAEDDPAPTTGRVDPNVGPTAAAWATLLDAAFDLPRYNAVNCTALHAAVIGGAQVITDAMLAAGASPNIALSTGLTPLMSSLLHGYEDVRVVWSA